MTNLNGTGETPERETRTPSGKGAGAQDGTFSDKGENASTSDGWKHEKRASGSYSADDPDRPRWGKDTVFECDYIYRHAEGTYAYSVLKGRRADGQKVYLRGRIVAPDEWQFAANADELYRLPGLEQYRKGSGPEPELLYHLPEVVSADAGTPILVVEGEKDADNLAALGFVATTNSNGAGKWSLSFTPYFADCDVFIFPDNDDVGRAHAAKVMEALINVARSVKIVELPNLPAKGDVSDWLSAGNGKGDLLAVMNSAGSGPSLSDFYAHMPTHSYIYVPTRELWPSVSVNARVAPVSIGGGRTVSAHTWLDQHRAVEQMTWAPGEPPVIRDRLVADGGWFDKAGSNTFNLYRPPVPISGDAALAGPWLDHLRFVYPDSAEHITNWLAHRVQRPHDKVNHALVLGGAMGIGKDTILEPAKVAVGAWNFAEVSPANVMGRFNGFVKSVILRISEGRDLGDLDRFKFYDHTKTLIAAPPDVLRVDEKNLREHSVFNVCGVILTTNHKGDGLFLPADDRRHYVAWSDLTREHFNEEYWNSLWNWYASGGIGHVVAFLRAHDIRDWNAKAPPPKTDAFWEIVAANSAPEDAELRDALDKLDWPEALTLMQVKGVADCAFGEWLADSRHARRIPHRMDECGYRVLRCPSVKDGRWKIYGKWQSIYVRKELSKHDGLLAVKRLMREGDNVPM